MNIYNILAILDGNKEHDFANGAIVCLVAVLLVFTVLLVIIGATSLISKLINKFVKDEPKIVTTSNNVVTNNNTVAVNIDDEDMMAAILVATIDYRNEVKEDVKVKSVREVK